MIESERKKYFSIKNKKIHLYTRFNYFDLYQENFFLRKINSAKIICNYIREEL